MFQGEEKDLGVGSMGLGVLEAGEDSEGSKDVCWRFGGLKLGRGGSQGAHKGVWCEGVPGAGLGPSLFPAEGMGGGVLGRGSRNWGWGLAPSAGGSCSARGCSEEAYAHLGKRSGSLQHGFRG